MKIHVFIIFCLSVETNTQETQPNIIFILADDLGFNDLSFRGNIEFMTPNIDALAYNGVVLNRFYTPSLCTPSRSSLMTGKYTLRNGMQHFVIVPNEPWGLPLREKLMPQYFKDVGYSTALIGKWHLGFFQQQYTPNRRGFDHFFGYLSSNIEYWTYENGGFIYPLGYDLRHNLDVDRTYNRTYATDMFTAEAVKVIKGHNKSKPLFLCINHFSPHAANEYDPMQAPEKVIEKFSYIENKDRRTLAAMIDVLDRGVGEVVEALKKTNMLNNTIIVFQSDNGGPVQGLHSTHASNWPLRGQKMSSFEGASRVNSIVYAPFLKQKGVVREQFMDVADWLRTLGNRAGCDFTNQTLDSIDQWSMINDGGPSLRDEIVNIDNVLNYSALIKGNYKWLTGSTDASLDGWISEKGSLPHPLLYFFEVMTSVANLAINGLTSNPLTYQRMINLRRSVQVACRGSGATCSSVQSPCLFNIIDDPCEENNLALSDPQKLLEMTQFFYDYLNATVPSNRKPADRASDPANFGGVWQWWQSDSV